MTITDVYGGSGTRFDPVSGGGYTLTTWVEFAHDSYFTHELCWDRSKATISENGNLYGGTLHLMLSNCSTQVDSVSPGFPGGGGTFTYYGNEVSAGCADATAYLVATNGYYLPAAGLGDSDSGRENG